MLIVDESDGPMATKHEFQAAMARAQDEHNTAMAAAACEHEQQISLIHQTYGVIYDNLVEDPRLLTLRWRAPADGTRASAAAEDFKSAETASAASSLAPSHEDEYDCALPRDLAGELRAPRRAPRAPPFESEIGSVRSASTLSFAEGQAGGPRPAGDEQPADPVPVSVAMWGFSELEEMPDAGMQLGDLPRTLLCSQQAASVRSDESAHC